MWPRYREAGRKEKGRLLDEVCRVTGYHRKYAVRCPNGPPPDSRPRRRRLRNMVFDQINNAPGLLQPLLQWGRLQDLGAAAGDPNPTLTMNSTAYDFMPERTYAWNVGLQQKLAHAIVFDIAYVGSSSKDNISIEYINAGISSRTTASAPSTRSVPRGRCRWSPG
jgi:hypothetical protein